MNGWIWLMMIGFIMFIMMLLLKILLLKKSANEIKKAFIEKQSNIPTL